MPFTFSHPAIVLPFGFVSSRWVSMNGLIAGSMSPDFEYFLRMKVFSIYSHTWLGVLWFNLPVVLVFLFIFHFFIRAPLIDHLPVGLRERFVNLRSFQWRILFTKRLVILITSIIIGAYTHIVWDSFTHSDGSIVKESRLLNSTIGLGGAEVKVYKLLQHGSTLIGFLVICGVIYRMPRISVEPNRANRLLFWSAIIFISVVITCLRFVVDQDALSTGNVITSAIAGGFIGLFVAAVAIARLTHPRS